MSSRKVRQVGVSLRLQLDYIGWSERGYTDPDFRTSVPEVVDVRQDTDVCRTETDRGVRALQIEESPVSESVQGVL